VPRPSLGGGFGLVWRRERVAAAGGEFMVESAPGRNLRRGVGAGVSSPRIRVVVVDDHSVVRDGLRGMLSGATDLEVVGEPGDGAQALAVVSLAPDVVLMDLRMPRMGGVQAITRLTATQPSVRVWCSRPMTPTTTSCGRSRRVRQRAAQGCAARRAVPCGSGRVSG
jgi:CheY-like chemotaxis protein